MKAEDAFDDAWSAGEVDGEYKSQARAAFMAGWHAALKHSPEANAQVPEGWKLVPIEPPESIPEQGYDEELFQHCRDDDYRGLYRAMLKRVTPPC